MYIYTDIRRLIVSANLITYLVVILCAYISRDFRGVVRDVRNNYEAMNFGLFVRFAQKDVFGGFHLF